MKSFFCCYFFLLINLSNYQTTGKIVGVWYYYKVESLGDYSQNDEQSKSDFDKTMKGKILLFSKDNNYKSIDKNTKSTIQTGTYTINPDENLLTMNGRETKIFLNDSLLKIYSPNNAIFVWKKNKLTTK